MKGIPRTPLVLGLAGLLPFLWGVLTRYIPALNDLTLQIAGPRFVAPYILLFYGTIILAFMSGVLWGFAARAEGETGGLGYALSVVPAIWAFLFAGTGPVSTAIYLIFGFLGVLGIDWLFWKNGLTPRWWMALRIPLTAVVVACLAVVALD
ncbi:DUF3429 domain-containing protein [Tropicimonas isoalkanivorans]|uniref:DUF3429 domain-containing protein n=1 Tax=Tropicimonas isoalkanivorans TaxID=441112 RepID=A0A1I1PLQ4_9RHOB|nr:DUF3429 domain-containing protein [Tropicimonas isoalkanivorans]SFD06930.1 Protein of unknown function [Tropicimonas isoalkanivorans]